MRFARRMREVGDSATLVMSARAKAMRAGGVDVVNMSAGEPDFPTPPNVVEAAQRFLAAGLVKYTATPGMPELRSAVAAQYSRNYGPELAAENVIVGNGGKQVLYGALQVLVDEGDEVLFASPYWVSYPEMTRLACGRPVPIPTSAADNFQLTAELLESHLSERSRVLILNTPSNPTGARLSRANLEAVVSLAVERGLWILSDEIYDRLCYDDEPYMSPLGLGAAVCARTLALNSLSKTYAMTGWRVGFAVGPAELVKAMGRVQAHATSNVNSLAQVAAIEALGGDQTRVVEQREAFDTRRKITFAGLRQIPGFACPEPQGAFYAFPRVADLFGKHLGDRRIEGSMDFSMALLEDANVATVPGFAFGDDDHIRLSYATSTAQIEEGLRRIRDLVQRLR